MEIMLSENKLAVKNKIVEIKQMLVEFVIYKR